MYGLYIYVLFEGSGVIFLRWIYVTAATAMIGGRRGEYANAKRACHRRAAKLCS